MAVGALIESRVRRKAATALIALASAAALDMTIFWDSRAAEYDWPKDSPPIPHVVPYPHDIRSWLLVIFLVVSAIAVAVLLRRYRWGMLWALMPDIIDWVVLNPLTGRYPIHELVEQVSTPCGLAVEMLFLVVVVVVLG